jgi:chromosome segregation ATPase
VDILSNEINKIKVETTKMPDEWRKDRDKPIKDLLDKIEAGIDKLINKIQEMTQAGLSNIATGRDLGGDDRAQQQGKQSTMDLSKMQTELLQNIERLNQQNMAIQKMTQALEGEAASAKQSVGQQQASGEQKQKEVQQARAERQQQRAERQQQRAEQRQTERSQQRTSERVQRQIERVQRQSERMQQQQQQQNELQQRQQRQSERTQRRLQRTQEQQQQATNRSAERDAARSVRNDATIADNLRQMRSEQLKQKNEPPAVYQSVSTQAAPTQPKAPDVGLAKQKAELEMMQTLLSTGGLQNMAALQNMEVPDALKPNSPARTIKAITQQKEMENLQAQAVEANKNSATPTADLPILIKQNQLTR